MRIRNLKDEDASTLAMVFHASVHAIGKRGYTQQQLDAWSPFPLTADAFLDRTYDGRTVFVAVDETDKAHAFIELETDGHIDRFYCHPDVAGRGIGKQLYHRLENEALSVGLTSLYVEASETAKSFFLRRSFTLVARRDFMRHNVWIHNYAMKKPIPNIS